MIQIINVEKSILIVLKHFCDDFYEKQKNGCIYLIYLGKKSQKLTSFFL